MNFVNKVNALTETSAGGAAAAYTAALGLGLVYKVLLFELNRKELATALRMLCE